LSSSQRRNLRRCVVMRMYGLLWRKSWSLRSGGAGVLVGEGTLRIQCVYLSVPIGPKWVGDRMRMPVHAQIREGGVC